MKKVFAAFLIVLLMNLPLIGWSESIIDVVPLKDKSRSEDAQGMYLASYYGNDIIREGAFDLNVDRIRPIFKHTNYPITETFNCTLKDENSLYIEAVYVFGDVAQVAFCTEPIQIQSLIPYCSTERMEDKIEGKDYLRFSFQSKEYCIDIETMLVQACNWATMRSILTVFCPFESENLPPESLHDVDIIIFDYLSTPFPFNIEDLPAETVMGIITIEID